MTAIRQKQLEFVDFQPQFEWKEETDAHLLIIPLPGFAKEQLRVTLNRNLNIITVQGRRQIEGNKWSRFIRGFPLPTNCKTEGIRAVCAAGNLTISILKQTPNSKNSNGVKQHQETLDSQHHATKHDSPAADEASDEVKQQQSPQKQRTPSPPPESKTTASESLQKSPESAIDGDKNRSSPTENFKNNESNASEEETVNKSNNSNKIEDESNEKNTIESEKVGWKSKGIGKFKTIKDVIACRERDRRLLGNVGAALLVLAAMAAFTAYMIKSWKWKNDES